VRREEGRDPWTGLRPPFLRNLEKPENKVSKLSFLLFSERLEETGGVWPRGLSETGRKEEKRAVSRGLFSGKKERKRLKSSLLSQKPQKEEKRMKPSPLLSSSPCGTFRPVSQLSLVSLPPTR